MIPTVEDDTAIPYDLRQRRRFAALRTALTDWLGTLHTPHLKSVLTDDYAHLQLSAPDQLHRIWHLHPNFEVDPHAGPEDPFYRPAAGFRLEETTCLPDAETEPQERMEILADVAAVCAYLGARVGER